MPRTKRITLGGYVYHVLNRTNGRLRIFKKRDDFLAFEQIISEGLERYRMRLCGWCIMSNHWHLLLWPVSDGELSEFMRWVTLTHTQRYHAAHGTVGIGHLYQGRFKSFPVQADGHYLTVLRYIEANPVRANIVSSAGDWPWSSFAVRNGVESLVTLSDGPVELPRQWVNLVNETIESRQLASLARSFERSASFGNSTWQAKTARDLGLESTMRPRGRPEKCTGHEWRFVKAILICFWG